jgi:hypothetical protein
MILFKSERHFRVDHEHEIADIARSIIDSILYMVLGTVDETGRPWVSPVYFSSEQYKEFYWMSSPDASHSRNIALRPQVSMVVFDSRIPVGTGQAVYMSAVAEELTGSALARGVEIYKGSFESPAEYGVRTIKLEDVRSPAPYRLYRATVIEHWILDPNTRPDHRICVKL